MNPSELVNIALEDKIEIEVTGKLPSIPLCEYDLGVFSPNQVREVPVFIALALKNSDICKIRAPFFLKQEYLQKIIEEEKLNEEYSKIYVYFFELSDILINNCYNIEDRKQIRLLVEQIRELRFQKTINGLKGLDGDVLKPQNWTVWEYNELKPFIVKGMKLINSLKKEE